MLFAKFRAKPPSEAREYVFPDGEPPRNARLDVELQAEVKRLCARHGNGLSEIEEIYRSRPGPVTRRWAVLDLVHKRVKRSLRPFMQGWLDVAVICYPAKVCIEVGYAENSASLRDAAVAQGEIILHLFPAEPAPNGNGIKTELPLTEAVPAKTGRTTFADRDAQPASPAPPAREQKTAPNPRGKPAPARKP